MRALTRLRALGDEITNIITHLARYPRGLRRWATDPAKPRGASRPVVLVPGLAEQVSIFTVLQQALQDRGVGPVVWFGYGPWVRDVRTAAGLLAEQVEDLCVSSGAARVTLVGHSLGGLIARYYVQRLGGHERVDTVVTVATPHAGTLAAWLLSPLPLVRQLRPGSRLFAELAEPAPDCRTRFVTFSSNADAVIVPRRSARIDHPDLTVKNQAVRDTGHVTLAVHPLVIEEVCALLGAERED